MKLRNKKTGEMCELKVTVNGDLTITKDDEITGIYPSLAELTEEWEDAPDEEPKAYWYIDDAGVMQVDQILSSKINMRKSIGNYFETKEEAEKAVEKLMAWKRLKDKGFRFAGWNWPLRVLSFEIDEEELSEETGKDIPLLFGDEEWQKSE